MYIYMYTYIYIYTHTYTSIDIYSTYSALQKSVAGAPWRLDGFAGSAGSAGAAHCLERRWIPSLDRLSWPGKPTKSYGKSPKSPFFIGKINYKWQFSIDMLNCQRIAMSFPGDFKQRWYNPYFKQRWYNPYINIYIYNPYQISITFG